MKRVLLISYFFPPDGGAGTQRAAKFAKFLGSHGWQTTVLTREPASNRIDWNPEDPTLLQEIGRETRVVRVASQPKPADWAAAVPRIDIARGWLEPAATAALATIHSWEPQAILVTMSPFDLCFLGRRLGDQSGLPVVYDLRDPWAIDGWRLYGTRRRWRLDFKCMVDALAAADGVIANTPESSRVLAETVPGLEADRIVVIPNGYDADDFGAVSSMTDKPVGLDGFCLVHTGTLHSDVLYRYEGLLGRVKKLRHYRPETIEPSGRSPYYLLKAVRLLIEHGAEVASRIRLVFVGQADEATRRCVRESGLSDRVEFTGYVSHKESVSWLRRADALFLPLHGLPPGSRARITPGKTYEYLAAGRPILGCLPPGDARDLVEASGLGICADPCDERAIARSLETLYKSWREGRFASCTPPVWLKEYDRRSLTGRLAEFLDRLTRSQREHG